MRTIKFACAAVIAAVAISAAAGVASASNLVLYEEPSGETVPTGASVKLSASKLVFRVPQQPGDTVFCENPGGIGLAGTVSINNKPSDTVLLESAFGGFDGSQICTTGGEVREQIHVTASGFPWQLHVKSGASVAAITGKIAISIPYTGPPCIYEGAKFAGVFNKFIVREGLTLSLTNSGALNLNTGISTNRCKRQFKMEGEFRAYGAAGQIGGYLTPIVTGISPSTGSKAGGATVTVTGTGFALGATATAVYFGTVKAASVNCVSTTTCTVVTPAHAAGAVDVKVTVNKVASNKNAPADQYTYEN
jgi:hypothetical protein